LCNATLFHFQEIPIMQAIRSILVVIEPEHSESLALKRAKLIAGVTQAHLHLLVCDPKHDHSGMLSVLKSALQEDGYSVTTEQAWNQSLHETIVEVQQAEGCGLVVKQHFPDSALKKALLTPADWKLLRHCPTPVLLVKTSGSWKDKVILAAVDVGNTDPEHRHLHNTIIDYGYDIASLAKAHLHVISAHPSPMLSATDPTLQLSETIEARYREQCKAFQAEFDIDDEHLHIAEGPADVLIPFMVHKLQAAVTVIGTVARSGLSGTLIGNTAEVVLDAVESDVLVLKPQEIEDHLEELAIKH
jgi:universal stress protein E